MQRALGVFETTQVVVNAHFPFNVAIAVLLLGAPPPERVSQALAALQRRHPLLRARVERHRHRFHYALQGVSEIPLRLLPRTSAEQWRAEVEQALATPFDLATGPPIRGVYLYGGAEAAAELVLCLQHAVVDAASAANLMHELLSLCAAADTVLPELSLGPATESGFPPELRGWRGVLRRLGFLGRQIADEIRYQRRARGMRRAPIHASGRCRVLHRDLDREATSALVRRCRRRRVTLNSALCAAMLLVLKRELYGRGNLPLRSFVFANLRPYLHPPIGPEHLGSHFAMMRMTTLVREDMDLWRLAGVLNRQTHAAARRGDKALSLLLTRSVMRMILGLRRMRMAHAALSYTGVASVAEQYGEIRLAGLHAWVSNFTLGPEYTAQARIYADRLVWDTLYLDSDMDAATAARLTEQMLDLLQTDV